MGKFIKYKEISVHGKKTFGITKTMLVFFLFNEHIFQLLQHNSSANRNLVMDFKHGITETL